MKSVNIFEVIRKTTSRIEPFHSEFLAEALRVSATGNRFLFDAVWKLAAPECWNIPRAPKIVSEKGFEDGKRIDICIFDELCGRVLGIEVKTTKASAEDGQLEAYLENLRKEYEEDLVAIAYLTPFNRERAGKNADLLPTVKIFDEFSRAFSNARHVSWLDIADIAWDSNDLWNQHRAYVHQEIANQARLQSFASRDRSFDAFFSETAVEEFWDALPVEGDKMPNAGVIMDLDNFQNDPESLSRAFEFLVMDEENVAQETERNDDFSEESRQRFLDSPYGDIHRAIFDLCANNKHVWLSGIKDYGLRVAHRRHSSGVSLLRSKGERCLLLGQPR